MRKLVLKMSMSTDAFVGGANGEMDWMFKSGDAESRAWTVDVISKASLHIMGSRTFQDMIAWWPQSTDVFAAPMNDIPKAVFSRSGAFGETTQALIDAARVDLPTPLDGASPEVAARRKEWANSPVLRGDLAEEVTRLKQADGGPIIAHGGARFVRSLIATGLVDEFALAVHPVTLGRGLPIFSDLAAPLRLSLVSSTAFPGGVIANVYRPA
jgi:dihydrofolate reductase